MTVYQKMAAHLERNVYSKGEFKGDAPLEGRGKRHLRVVKHDNAYAVRMYNTDILTVTEDDKVTIDCSGWSERNTTRSNLNTALAMFCGRTAAVFKLSRFSYSQMVLRLDGKAYRYYDGITFDNSTRQITTTLKPFRRKRTSATKAAELNEGLAESGFKDAFKMLWAVSETPTNYLRYRRPTAYHLTDAEHSETWPDLVRCAAFTLTRPLAFTRTCTSSRPRPRHGAASCTRSRKK
jgi:hypothetical protein